MKLRDKIKLKMQEYLGLDVLSESLYDYCECLNENTTQVDRDIETVGDMIEALEDKYGKHLEKLNRYNRDINRLTSIINENSEDIGILHNTIKNVVSVGADTVPNPYHNDGRSWAVVCVEGRYNIVKFIDLNGQDYRYFLDFLKQFEGSRMVIDAPHGGCFEGAFKF